MSDSALVAVDIFLLLVAANGAPLLATRLLGSRGAWPLDGGMGAWDGRPLLGSSKTVRGLLIALVATALTALALGLGWRLGLAFGSASMIGDLFSSFVKRRLGIEASGRAIGLDQIPEALFPLLVCYRALDLDVGTAVTLVVVFTLGQALVSPLMFRLGLRRRPY